MLPSISPMAAEVKARRLPTGPVPGLALPPDALFKMEYELLICREDQLGGAAKPVIDIQLDQTPISLFVLWDDDPDIKLIGATGDGYILRVFHVSGDTARSAFEGWTRSGPEFLFVDDKPAFTLFRGDDRDLLDPATMRRRLYVWDGSKFTERDR